MYLELDMKLMAAKCLYDEADAKLRSRAVSPQELVLLFGQAKLELFEAGDHLVACWAIFFEGSACVSFGDYPNAYETAMEVFREFGVEDVANVIQDLRSLF
jgi:hypothetical protein